VCKYFDSKGVPNSNCGVLCRYSTFKEVPKDNCNVTAKAKSFQSVLHNYEALLETLLFVAVGIDGVTCLKVTTKASGIHTKLEKCDLFFAIAVCTKFYSLSDRLSTALQCRARVTNMVPASTRSPARTTWVTRGLVLTIA